MTHTPEVSPPHILVILGSSREHRVGRIVAHWFTRQTELRADMEPEAHRLCVLRRLRRRRARDAATSRGVGGAADGAGGHLRISADGRFDTRTGGAVVGRGPTPPPCGTLAPEQAPEARASERPPDDAIARATRDAMRVAGCQRRDVVGDACRAVHVGYEAAPPHASASLTNCAASSASSARSGSSDSITASKRAAPSGSVVPIESPSESQ